MKAWYHTAKKKDRFSAYKAIPSEKIDYKYDAYGLYLKFIKESVRQEQEMFRSDEGDVQEVKHGHWEPRPSILGGGYKCYECSVCGKEIEISDRSDVIEECPYCFGCGARMDGESQ